MESGIILVEKNELYIYLKDKKRVITMYITNRIPKQFSKVGCGSFCDQLTSKLRNVQGEKGSVLLILLPEQGDCHL